jgi:stringent starvation protein B
MTELLPPKKEVALALLERSNVDVYLDPRARGVVVPPQFRKEPRLILKIGLNMPVPIRDLRLDEESMSCTLSFNRSPFYCVVPWSSVFAMVGEDGRGMVWPDDVPQELAVKVVEPGTESSRAPAAPAAPSNGSTGARRAARGSKLAEDTSSREAREASAAAREAPGAARRGAKKKKTSKKDEQPCPMLVAVPSPVPSPVSSPREAREAEVGAADRAAPAERRPRQGPPDRAGERRDGVSPIPSARASRGAPSSRIPPSAPPVQGRPEGARPKRELPPYLRVVK